MTSSGSLFQPPAAAPDDLPTRLQTWVGLGLITRAQADRILAAERGEPVAPPRRSASVLAEALGYVGGVLILMLVAALLWWPTGFSGRADWMHLPFSLTSDGMGYRTGDAVFLGALVAAAVVSALVGSAWPKFGIAASSFSVLDTRSPIVSMPTRLRQL